MDDRFIKHFTKSRYIGIVYDLTGNPINAYNIDTHFYQHLILQMMSQNVSEFYKTPDIVNLKDLSLSGAAFYSKNIVETEHLLPDFVIERPLSSIRFLELEDEYFLGVISFPGFLSQLKTANDKPLILTDGENRIFGFNGALLRTLFISNSTELIGRNVRDIIHFADEFPPPLINAVYKNVLLDWNSDTPFPGKTIHDLQATFIELNTELDVDSTDFSLVVDYTSEEGSMPGIVFRGSIKKPFVFPDLVGYTLAKPANESLQFKRGADKVRLMRFSKPVAEQPVRIEIKKAGAQFDFYINGERKGYYNESAPFLTPSDNRIYLYFYSGQSVNIKAIKLSSSPLIGQLFKPVSAEYRTGSRNLRFNVSVRYETIDEINCNRYQLEDITDLLESIDLLTREKNELAELLVENRHLGESEIMRTIRSDCAKVAATGISVLIEGETGTGKEVLARTIYEGSGRREKPFVKIDCSTIPESLMESELFGHEKGAFTGALASHAGRFEQAEGGTLFLDEVSNLSLTVQAKLLGVIQDRAIIRVGGTKQIPLNIRIISASNISLLKLAADGKFRTDLYYRLAEFTFQLPSLRKRVDDIPQLVAKFLSEASLLYKKKKCRCSASCLEKLINHNWPGNIRELRNAVFKAVLLAESDVINEENIRLDIAFQNGGRPNGRVNLTADELRAIISECGGNMSKAAARIGTSRVTLYKKMRKFGQK